jgi:uncharacterized protein
MLEQTRSRRPDIVTPRGILFFCSTKRLAGRSWPCYKMSMPLDFNTKKDAQNRKAHGLSLAEADNFDFDTAVVVEVDREHYGEQRFFAIGQLKSGQIIALTYTYREDEVRPISLRNATPKERRRWHEG